MRIDSTRLLCSGLGRCMHGTIGCLVTQCAVAIHSSPPNHACTFMILTTTSRIMEVFATRRQFCIVPSVTSAEESLVCAF